MRTRRIGWVAVTLLLVVSCYARKETGGEPGPSGSPARSVELYRKSPEERVVWLVDIAGYVPPDLAAKYQRFPDRFVLYGDGRVVYRNQAFEHREVRLDEGEVEIFLEPFLELAALEPLLDPDANRMLVLDAGNEIIGARLHGQQTELVLDGGATFLAREFPQNERVQTVKQLRDRLVDFSHPRSTPIELR